MNLFSEILNDEVVMREIVRENVERRNNMRNLFLNSQYTFSLIYHPNQKNLLGSVDTFSIEGGINAQKVLNLKMMYNVGISQIRISRNGKRIKTINLKGNEQKSLNFKNISLV